MRNDLTNMVIIEDDTGTLALTWFEHSIENVLESANITGKALSYLSNPNLAGHYLAPSVLIMKKIKNTSNLNSHPNFFWDVAFSGTLGNLLIRNFSFFWLVIAITLVLLLRHSTASWKEYFKLNFTNFKRMGGGGRGGGGDKGKIWWPAKNNCCIYVSLCKS